MCSSLHLYRGLRSNSSPSVRPSSSVGRACGLERCRCRDLLGWLSQPNAGRRHPCRSIGRLSRSARGNPPPNQLRRTRIAGRRRNSTINLLPRRHAPAGSACRPVRRSRRSVRSRRPISGGRRLQLLPGRSRQDASTPPLRGRPLQ